MSLLVETRHQKVGHAPSRILTRRRMGGPWIGFWLRCFEKNCRSPLCAPDDVVGVGKYRWEKKSPEKSPENIAGKMLTVMRVFWPRYGWPESFGRWKRWSEWNMVTGRIPGINYMGPFWSTLKLGLLIEYILVLSFFNCSLSLICCHLLHLILL